MIPKETLILLSGIRATRKSTFGLYLASKHSFAHYDIECYPRSWPHPELYKAFLNDRHAFVKQLREQHDRTVLDWGFPVRCLSWVDELSCGVRLIWFSGDIAHAREEFKKRGACKGPEDNFNKQVTAIQKEGYPASLDCVIVPALSSSGVFLDQRQIENIVFPPTMPAYV